MDRVWGVLIGVSVLVVLSLSAVSCTTVSFIDVEEPIVRSSPEDNDQVEDFFGYAVTLHQLEELQEGDSVETALGKTRIIVGAPKGTFPGGLLNYPDLGDPRDPRTGLVYVCPVDQGMCDGLRGNLSLYSPDDTNDYDFDEAKLFDHYGGPTLVDPSDPMRPLCLHTKTGQLMGFSLFSNGDNFIACAPRWAKDLFKEPVPRGRCFISDRSLTGFQKLWPCRRNTGNEYTAQGDRYCIAGTGVTIVRNNTEDIVVMGAPGYSRFRGRLYYHIPNTFVGPDLNMLPGLLDQTPGFDFKLGTDLAVDPEGGGVLVGLNDIDQGLYVITGFVTKRKEATAIPDILTSVPRYDATTYTGRVNIFDINDPDTILDVTAVGEQIAEFFGYSLAAVDLTGDGYDEVIVGAPMYTTFSDTGNNMVERGRAYVFLNLEGTLSTEPVRLDGLVAGGRFGTSMTNLGDVDDDGYEDVAIGAPYACQSPDRSHPVSLCAGQNSGAVYIYYGRANLSEFESQTPFKIDSDTIVQAVDGLEDLNSFGFSLSSGVDVDGNENNDLAIGAYQSKVAVILRSFPVVTINFTLPKIDAIDYTDPSSLCTQDGLEYMYYCFYFNVSAKYSGRGRSGSLSVNFTVSEVMVSGGSRVFFDGNAETASGQLTFTDPGVEDTTSFRVFLRRMVSDLLTPVELSVSIPKEFPRPAVSTDGNRVPTDLSPFPRLNQAGDASQTVELCGADMICQSDLEAVRIDSIKYFNDEGEEVDAILVGGTREIWIKFVYSNLGPEGAAGVTVTSNVTELLNANLMIDTVRALEEDCTVTGAMITCDVASVLVFNELNYTLKLPLAEHDQNLLLETLQSRNNNFSLTFQFNVEDNGDPDLSNNDITGDFTIQGEADIQVSLDFTPENSTLYVGSGVSRVTSVSDLGVITQLNVIITNRGPTRIPAANLDIYFPGQPVTENGNVYYLYPSTVRVVTPDYISCNASAADPDGLVQDGDDRRRRSVMHPLMWRKLNPAVPGRKRRQRQSGGGATVDCQSNPQRCIFFSCNISDLPRDEVGIVRIEGVVDERFYEDMEAVFVLRAFADSSITSDLLRDEAITGNNDDTAALVLSPEPEEDDDDDDDDEELIHAIIWPTVGVLIIIVILALVLWRLGFFRRKTKAKITEGEEEGPAPAGGQAEQTPTKEPLEEQS